MMEQKINLKNVLLNKDVCGICLKLERKNINVHTVFVVENGYLKIDHSLEEILCFTFGMDITRLLPTKYLCDNCIAIVLNAYLTKQKIIKNHNTLEKYLNTIVEHLNNTNVENANSFKVILDLKPDISKANLEKSKKASDKTSCDFNTDPISDLEDVNHDISSSDIKIPKYECAYCEQKYNNFIAYKIHYDTNHIKESTFKCRKCNKSYTKFEHFMTHMKSEHYEHKLFCEICKVILHRKKRKKHILQHHKSDKLLCDLCNKSFFTKTDIEKHIIQKHNNITCQQCTKSFTSELQQKTHRCFYKCTECIKICIHKKYLSSFRDQHCNGVKTYKCVDCDYTYTHKHQLLSHANKKHLNNYPHLCHSCGAKFATKDLLKYHCNSKHVNPFKCEFCYKSFKDQNSLDVHLPLCKITDRPHECNLCGCRFTSEEKLEFHKRKHFSKDFQCQHCPKKYWSKGELNVHLKRSHADKIDRKKRIYQCTMCPLDFNSRKDLTEHIVTHPENTVHICRVCNDSFQSKINYYAHIRKHTIKKDKECPICLRIFNKYNIEKHIKTHLKDKDKDRNVKNLQKNTMCDICGALLSSEKSLTKHRETHKEQKQCPHCLKYINSILYDKHLNTHVDSKETKLRRKRKLVSCQKCDYTTNFTECLDAHINRFHLQIRPFQCDICKKSFYAKLTLKEHIRTHLGMKPEQCEHCGNRFVNKKALKLHVRIHTGERPYDCDLCDEKFLSASRRQAHRIRKHFDPSVQCPVCLKMYYTQSAMRLHMRDCHSTEPSPRKKKRL